MMPRVLWLPWPAVVIDPGFAEDLAAEALRDSRRLCSRV